MLMLYQNDNFFASSKFFPDLIGRLSRDFGCVFEDDEPNAG